MNIEVVYTGALRCCMPGLPEGLLGWPWYRGGAVRRGPSCDRGSSMARMLPIGYTSDPTQPRQLPRCTNAHAAGRCKSFMYTSSRQHNEHNVKRNVTWLQIYKRLFSRERDGSPGVGGRSMPWWAGARVAASAPADSVGPLSQLSWTASILKRYRAPFFGSGLSRHVWVASRPLRRAFAMQVITRIGAGARAEAPWVR